MAKHIFVTGGVVSSLGKGLTSASIGMLLEKRGLSRADAEARSVHQRRPGHDEPVPARRSVRAGRRQRNRSRPGPLRAIHAQPAHARFELHDRADLPVGDQQGAARRVPGQDGAGDSAHHQRNQERHRQAGRGSPRPRRRRDHRDRRHGRRHREPAVPGSDSPVRARRRQGELPLHSPHAGAVFEGGQGAQDEADAALGRPAPPDRYSAGHPHLPHRAFALRATTARRSPCSATSRSTP